MRIYDKDIWIKIKFIWKYRLYKDGYFVSDLFINTQSAVSFHDISC